MSLKRNPPWKKNSQTDILTKWNFYTPHQKEAILAELRKKLPQDNYCNATLVEFLREKLIRRKHQTTTQ
jgi:predicted Fe-S protein YdhL (DUF1289 family)